MQLLQLLEGLTPAELNTFEKQLKEGSRKEPHLLFREFRKCVGAAVEFDRTKSYKKVYNETWTAEKDYKMRNDLRKLKKDLYQYLVALTINKELQENEVLFSTYLNKALAERKIDELFELEIESAIEKAKEAYDYLNLSTLLNTYTSDYLGHSRLVNSKKDAQYFEVLKERLIIEKKRFVHQIRDIETQWANRLATAIQRRGGNINNEMVGDYPKMSHFNFEEVEDHWTRCKALRRELVSYSIGSEMEQQRAIAIEYIELLEAIPKKTKEQLEYLIEGLFNLHALYIHSYQFKEALDTGQQLLVTVKANDLALPENYLRGKMLTLTLLKRWEEALAFFNENKTDFKKYDTFVFESCMASYLYLVLDKSKEALGQLKEGLETLGERPIEVVEGLVRYIHIIAFIVDKEYDQALRELDNFRRSKMMEHVPDPERVIEMINIYKKYIRILSAPGMSDKIELRELLENLKSMHPLVMINSPVYRWIRFRLEAELGA